MSVVGISAFPISTFEFMNLILGLNAFHPDSSACVLKDGKMVAAVAEESRLSELFRSDILLQYERTGNYC